jgi:hypothetical protein
MNNDDPNREETEEDGYHAEAIRRLMVRRLSQVRPGQPRGSWMLRDLMPLPQASPTGDKPSMPK